MRRAFLLAFGFIAAAGSAPAQQVDGAGVFSQNCAGCHAASGVTRAPQLESLRLLEPRFVLDTLASGVMLNLMVRYWLEVGRLETRGRPRR